MIHGYAVLPSRCYPQDSKWWGKLSALRHTPESAEPRWGYVDRAEGVVGIGYWMKRRLSLDTLFRVKGLKVKVVPVEGDVASVSDEYVLEGVMNLWAARTEGGT